MHKLWLIIKREYLTRVKSKTFLLTTFLTPVGILAFILILGWIMSYKSDKTVNILVKDEAGILEATPVTNKKFVLKFEDANLETLKGKVKDEPYQGLLYLPKLDSIGVSNYKAWYYADKTLDLESTYSLSSTIRSKIKEFKMRKMGLRAEQLRLLKTHVSIDPEPLSEGVEDKSSMAGVVASAVGGVMGYFMFIIIIMYGTMIMRSVSEEKINRIVEIIISSVKPFYLMLGKIIGVGGVGFTQLAIWLVTVPLVMFGANRFLGVDTHPTVGVEGKIPAEVTSSLMEKATQVMTELGHMNWWIILPVFIFFFIAGYLMYAALFAALGSAIGEDMNDAQSLTFPVMLPIIISTYIMFSVIKEPHSPLAFWSSLFPLTSPIIMPVRAVYDTPWWQLLLSMAILAITVVGLVWLSGRIYRIGILMYGKKASYKDLIKWIRTK